MEKKIRDILAKHFGEILTEIDEIGNVIDFSKFTLKCSSMECEENENNLCCVLCKSYDACLEKGWVCICLEDGSPENCKDLYLKNENIK